MDILLIASQMTPPFKLIQGMVEKRLTQVASNVIISFDTVGK
jgi:hypothetical protein